MSDPDTVETLCSKCDEGFALSPDNKSCEGVLDIENNIFKRVHIYFLLLGALTLYSFSVTISYNLRMNKDLFNATTIN